MKRRYTSYQKEGSGCIESHKVPQSTQACSPAQGLVEKMQFTFGW